jgi:hypothetical protein
MSSFRFPLNLRPLAIFLAAPMGLGAGDIPASDLHNSAQVRREMTIYNPRYGLLMPARMQALHALERQVFDREAQGRDASCSHQILTELRWLIGNTADVDPIDARLADLRSSLAHPEQESRARQQDPGDGSWGRCSNAWFFKLDASYDGHFANGEGGAKIPLLDRVNSPDKLANYMKSLSISDVAHTGVSHRRELNESLSSLIRLILHDRPDGYPWHPDLKRTLLDLVLNQLRNPQTGWWGERYLREGQVEVVDDLSITFHVVRYLQGGVPDLDKVGDTLLRLKDLEYPIGWLENGRYANHHDMDVVVLFGYAWPHLDEAQRRAASIEIGKMLQWCLKDSVLPDGSFRPSTDDASIEEREYFGVAFLARIGYFDPSRRFWTAQAFPEAEELRRRLIGFIERHKGTGAAGGAYYESALHELGKPG